MRTLLICHEEEPLNRLAMPRWLASFSDLCGIIVLRETPDRKRRRVRREIERVGWLRFADVIAFRLYYRLFLAGADREWEAATLRRIENEYPAVPATVETLVTTSPNTKEAEDFIRQKGPDIIIARCKTLLAQRIFTLASKGTYVMHPGICPDYRNAHGCFWALAQNDVDNVGMTLLRIDKGVDTGPVYSHFRLRPNESESHIVIQHRSVFDFLPEIAARLEEIAAGGAVPIDTRGRPSAEWGQPWLTRYLAWKKAAQRRLAARRATA